MLQSTHSVWHGTVSACKIGRFFATRSCFASRRSSPPISRQSNERLGAEEHCRIGPGSASEQLEVEWCAIPTAVATVCDRAISLSDFEVDACEERDFKGRAPFEN